MPRCLLVFIITKQPCAVFITQRDAFPPTAKLHTTSDAVGTHMHDAIPMMALTAVKRISIVVHDIIMHYNIAVGPTDVHKHESRDCINTLLDSSSFETTASVIRTSTARLYARPGAIPTPESESNDDSDSDSGVGIGVGIICSSFWWSRNRSRNRGDWNRNRSRNRGDWNRSWNGNQMTIPHIYVHVPSNIHSGSNPQET